MGDEGINGFAARKQKKNHPKGLKSNHFRPRARRARGRKWLLLEARGMNFFLLKGGKTISAQLNYVENAFLYVY